MSPALIAALPFIGALLPGLLIRSGRDVAAISCATATFIALLGLCLHVPAIMAGEVITARFAWLPSLGLNAHFRIDGLGLLFGILILGIGLLIIAYARHYLSREDPVGVFYTYLMLFQGAMLGIVLSDNILLLLVFWELTSLSSFLLIGYWKHLPEGRQGARMALTVTGMGGLAMIAGMLILGNIAGSFDIGDILQAREAIQASPYYLPALLLILLGAFTKSAQFPFHFWLPHAMAAPTPVSAYLHSATMVKAGLFLMARLWPVLSGTPEWFYIVATTGLVTMVLAAWIAIFRDDLKSLLAFSTVSHLGLITMLLGFGTEAAAVAAVFHIINHATFKAALFMAAGIIDHEAGTRSIARLGGLRRLMPVTFVIGTVAALSMAGIPPLNGFLSKELMLEEATHAAWQGSPVLIAAMATLGALFSVCYSLRFVWQVFFGPERQDYPRRPHDPGFGLWSAPALLVVLVVLIGLFPAGMAGWLVEVSASAVTGTAQHPHLALWHGVTPALMLSITALVGGTLLLALNRHLLAMRAAMAWLDAKAIFDAVTRAATCAAGVFTDRLTNGSMSRALAAFSLTVVLCGFWAFSTGGWQGATRPMLPVQPVPLVGWILLMVAICCMVAFHRRRILALVLVGIIGLMVSVSFIYFSAPDLALTQISVEVVTVVLLLLALNFLPKFTVIESPDRKRGLDAFIAALAGLGFGALAYAIMRSDFAFSPISEYMLANSYRLGGGDNVVNVILVDFRGYDTFGEITVLGIAALTIFALTETLLAGASGRRLRNWVHDSRRAGDRHPLTLVVVTRLILPISLVVGLYIFLRGHNMPGGGFVAGLVVSVALVSQYMASGFAWAQERQKINYHALIGAGVIAAGLTGIGAWFAGLPFLTSAYGYVKLPGLEEFELASAMGFDLGVFLCVVGAVMLALNSLSRIARQAGETVNLDPMDIDPSREARR
ncbi:monovalent cation/H+ antiporter subunit A [Paracoccus sp. P2]|uniref:Monovalent cation/H+ antiporter subunit A n=1 Tax=Paracoccus pantotrophus TaxID=82367 RepID=A0A7H9C0H4_PARPN|nr:monovalent cation/H+ antiporter subunit A [Paracoccus pantotrophus]MDF3853456.1 monovalent cation/H+ antiporter subunit A [Paracoccus pantotrophus]QLH15581.1 monovalent cation/H+ antiporter subunit A [Paracoccus pantotrophus]RDD96841.1 monovalent cation/H+ antiporter subunit A [Paracoccus pantotrophus]RNI20102.1 monovalent cation/H+ antiporter subunit A [Paracoccus pantotrophus]WGR65724.1 monovalent cation/H+ antiporter subunit A [Paracoccus pantotrophus]